jgi:hypothetical protein
MPEEAQEVAENKATILAAMKGQEAARKCVCQFETKKNITVMCIEV